MKRYFPAFLLWYISFWANAQVNAFEFVLKPSTVPGLGGVQSFASGEYEGKFFIFGGRLDGLHRRQPFASFDLAGHNNQILMVDPVSAKVWKRNVSELPAEIAEPLTSTNIQFYQEGNYLWLIGGYGYSPTIGDHTTYNSVTRADLKKLHSAMTENKSMEGVFIQIRDDRFQVTGGYLGKINDYYYLAGGQKFLGRYNPMGPDFGPGFIQKYSDAVKKFRLSVNANTIVIQDYTEWVNADLFHRRDYNMAAQIMPDGTQGLTVFSGVFRKDADLPFLNCVNISENAYAVQPDFNQLYNHYHCAHTAMYDSIHKEMHTVFYGGIAQYYEENGMLVKDDNVPFVRTIATVWRDASGVMKEKKLVSEMPALLGAGAEFIRSRSVPSYDNGVIKYHAIQEDSILLGYIFGGIASSAKNIFFVNDGTQSTASPVLYKVYLVRKTTSGTFDTEPAGEDFMYGIYPNPASDDLYIALELKESKNLVITFTDTTGRILLREEWPGITKGKYKIVKKIPFSEQKMILIHISDGKSTQTKKIVKI